MAASDDYQRTVLEFIRSHPEGIAETVLEDRLKGMSQEMRVQAINDLLMQGKIVLFQHATLGRFYREVQHDLSRLVALSAEERLVYNYIEAAGDKGIWIADLKFKSNIPPMSLQKLLKNLERKKLIKSVKPVTNKTRKVYMLAHLEPSREITGGAWYSDNELDQEMIAVCQKTALAFIMQNRFGTLEQVHSFIRQHKLLTVELRADEVQAVLDTLLYDGRIEQFTVEGGVPLYRPVRSSVPQSSFSDIPCAACPVFRDCTDDGLINPRSCEFMQRWLGF